MQAFSSHTKPLYPSLTLSPSSCSELRSIGCSSTRLPAWQETGRRGFSSVVCVRSWLDRVCFKWFNGIESLLAGLWLTRDIVARRRVVREISSRSYNGIGWDIRSRNDRDELGLYQDHPSTGSVTDQNRTYKGSVIMHATLSYVKEKGTHAMKALLKTC